jgi:hypothetical protein
MASRASGLTSRSCTTFLFSFSRSSHTLPFADSAAGGAATGCQFKAHRNKNKETESNLIHHESPTKGILRIGSTFKFHPSAFRIYSTTNPQPIKTKKPERVNLQVSPVGSEPTDRSTGPAASSVEVIYFVTGIKARLRPILGTKIYTSVLVSFGLRSSQTWPQYLS